ncbi:MAG TPA: proline dehydrogenase family protein [Pseudonocardiaceae bacterium]
MLGQILLSASRSPLARNLVTTIPVTRKVVDRFVAGEELQDALRATRELVAANLYVTLDHLGEDTLDAEQAARTRDAYLSLLAKLGELGLTDRAEVSVKLSALGQALARDGDRIALENARAICQAAAAVGTTVTLDMEDHTTVDSTLGILRELRADFPWVGAVLQSCLRRTEGDCRDLAHAGSRVRLVKGAYAEPASVAYQDKAEVDRAYVRCLRILMGGEGYPMVASHDPRLIAITLDLARRLGRAPGSYEFQMLYGIRPEEQRRLAAAGERMRVYVPYGTDWYGYFMRRLAERPANVAFFLRALGSRS